jgi:hypothetical protein
MSEAGQQRTPAAFPNGGRGSGRGRGRPACHYAGWLKDGKGAWRQVVAAEDAAACYRQLLAPIRQLPATPLASAVLPVGVHPAERPGLILCAGSVMPAAPATRDNASGAGGRAEE